VDLAAAYRACARLTRREARNFYVAFLSLPRRQRLAVYALYAFCRSADDAADSCEPTDSHESLTEKSAGSALLKEDDAVDSATPRNGAESIALGRPSETAQPKGAREIGSHESLTEKSAGSALRESGSIEARRVALARLRARLTKAAAGDPEDGPDRALADAIERFGVDPNDLAEVLDGMEIDLALRRIDDFETLRAYCYRVASAVGLATLPILNGGIPPTDAMRDAAVDLGLGMQLVNILRDVAEDLQRDRIYLPLDEMAEAGVGESDLRRAATGGEIGDALVRFLEGQTDRAAAYLERGCRLVPLLPRRGRRCPRLLAEIYGRILDRICEGGFDLSTRVGLPAREKAGLLVSSLWGRP